MTIEHGVGGFDVLCIFFGFFGISVPLHIVVRTNSIEILRYVLSRGRGKYSIFDNKKIVLFTVADPCRSRNERGML